jgi:sugar phosphate permease
MSVIRKPRVFYGWWIVIASLGLMLVMAGTGFYSFGVIFKPLMSDFGWSRGVVSLAQSVYMLTAAVSGLFVGKLLERYSVRRVVFLGALLGGSCWFLLSLTQSLWQFYTLHFFLGVGFGGAGLVPVAVLISNWFNKRRGMAMGVATVGIALGAMIIVPIVNVVLGSFGWRAAYIFMGSVVFAIDIPLALLVLKTSPEEMGMFPDGDESSGAFESAVLESQVTVASAVNQDQRRLPIWLRSLPLWLLSAGFTLAQIGEMSILIHEVPFITDMGISAGTAAVALGSTGGMGGLGKIVFGWLTDRISTRYVTLLCFLLQLVGLLILMRTNSMTMVWLFVVIFGFAMGGMPTLLPLAIGDLFARVSFGVIYGFVHFIVIGFSILGPPLAGFTFDLTGSYSTVFMIFVATYIVSVITVYFAWGPGPRPLIVLRGRQPSG